MSRSRRQVLSACTALLAGLAGCAGSRRDRSEPSSVESGSIQDPTTVTLRNPSGDAVLREGDEEERVLTQSLVASRERADEIEYEPGVPDEQAEAATQFLEETAFDEAAVYLDRLRVESCTRYRIQSVSWDESRVDYDYCWELRPPDVACETEEREPVVMLVRIPAPLERDRLTSSGASGSGCRDPETDYETISLEESGEDR